MEFAYHYARNQILGMQFEDFTLEKDGLFYFWAPDGWLKAALIRLIATGHENLARMIFDVFLEED